MTRICPLSTWATLTKTRLTRLDLNHIFPTSRVLLATSRNHMASNHLRVVVCGCLLVLLLTPFFGFCFSSRSSSARPPRPTHPRARP